ncbi:hypothetical protein MGMO_15c00430 [Methyloglobulus morosus KoM1]|uniref:Uncharacterized protein n=1 Tax=Methyloglobulus morosus KoM1 TaxID=1116472 RepID=V5C577_9GAMM|nr:hypothetical protein [Methyloglobulus morosus]ESS73622.1 hypothetical protein MGMO_15c00430 [Methyloglobulus morosus KoM1]
MNNIIATRGKEIIICLLIVILILVIFLLKPCSSIEPNGPISQAKLDNFKKILLDSKQNVHAVALLAPNQGGKLVIFNKLLEPVQPCFTSPDKIKPGERIKIEDDCLKAGPAEKGKKLIIKAEEGNEQFIALTPGVAIENNDDSNSSRDENKKELGSIKTTATKDDHSTFLFITELDKRQHVTCQNPNGLPCPPHY